MKKVIIFNIFSKEHVIFARGMTLFHELFIFLSFILIKRRFLQILEVKKHSCFHAAVLFLKEKFISKKISHTNQCSPPLRRARFFQRVRPSWCNNRW